MNISSLLQSLQKSSIRIEYDAKSEAEVPVGVSKIGGKPDLPSDFEWYYFHGKTYEGVSENRPLSFLAQINCEEASKYDKDSLLPSKGMLYFFYEIATMAWGYDPKDKGSARVYYYSGDISELIRTDFPSDLLEEFQLPEMAIAFSVHNELPFFEEFIVSHEEFGHNRYDDYDKAKNTIVPESDEVGISKLFGYADLIQSEMVLQCELTTNGIYTGNSEGYAHVTAEQKENCSKWQLLLQLDSIQTENYEMLWGDDGHIYYYINIDDLKASNFDNCWLILQCY